MGYTSWAGGDSSMSDGKGRDKTAYQGFEQGPIRPPSEAYSLLIRVTRNCPWNRCSFCPVYKTAKFSFRPVEHVKKDIDLVHKHVEALRLMADESGRIPPAETRKLIQNTEPGEAAAFNAAFNWLFAGGMRSVFLQDADSLVMKPGDLVEILLHLRERFPSVKRITSYSRAHTIARKKDGDLKAIRDAGLNRIHVGLESGSDQVLAMVKKGVTKEIQISAGLKVKQAGMELSEYVMPGLGGRELSRIHALETADALNQIDPDFIRLRTLAIPPHAPLFEEYRAGRFEKCTDSMVAEELLLFIEKLDGITSVVKSDHILNLFIDLHGRLPKDKERMLRLLRTYLAMEPSDQLLYQVGRRLGVFTRIRDMEDGPKRAEVEEACRVLKVTPHNVDEITDQMMIRYI
jgi:hypothetical protein